MSVYLLIHSIESKKPGASSTNTVYFVHHDDTTNPTLASGCAEQNVVIVVVVVVNKTFGEAKIHRCRLKIDRPSAANWPIYFSNLVKERFEIDSQYTRKSQPHQAHQ